MEDSEILKERAQNLWASFARKVEPVAQAIRRVGALERVCVGSFSDRRVKRARDILGPQLCTTLGRRGVLRLRLASYGLPVGGFVEANLDEVASRAGVAKGTLYRYFESKADLYVAVLAENSAIAAAIAASRASTAGAGTSQSSACRARN